MSSRKTNQMVKLSECNSKLACTSTDLEEEGKMKLPKYGHAESRILRMYADQMFGTNAESNGEGLDLVKHI